MTDKSKMTLIISVAVLLLIFCLIKCAGGGDSNTITVQVLEQPKSNPDISKSDVNVYVENSGSMDGYVNGPTSFKDALYSYLQVIKDNESNKFTFNYVNTSVHAVQNQDLRNVVKNLNTSSFISAGGDRTSSDIANVLKLVLDNTKKNDVSLLVSDFILSPGKGKNASDYENDQKVTIRGLVSDFKKKHTDLAIVVLQLYSEFNGKYYNIQDEPKSIKDKRPYYIWIIGDRNRVSKIWEDRKYLRVHDDDIIREFAVITGPVKLKSVVVDKFGKKNNLIEKKMNSYDFQLRVDCRPLLLDSIYLKDVNNYKLNDENYKIKKIKVLKDDNEDYTNSILVYTNQPRRMTGGEKVSIKLNCSEPPAWINDCNDDFGMDVSAKGAMSKTFGIKYILQGVYDAFYPNGKGTLVDYKLNIK
ncbi:MAG: hypothetical protein KA051_00895 [Paludibacteraceae bacterium]|jgi:hypothetical protein|nr:hypothetical protein [Paludibacteraceae bacterium]